MLNANGKVRAVFVEAPANNASAQAPKKTPRLWYIAAANLTYWDKENRAHLDGDVTVQSAATNVEVPPMSGSTGVYVFDQVLHKATRVSIKPDGSEPDHDCVKPQISADGSMVVFISAAMNLRGDITSKLSSTTRVGYLIRTPDSSSQVGFSGLFLAGDTTYRPTERTTITLATQRTPQESTFGTGAFYVTTNAILSLSQQLLPKLTAIARLGGGVNDYSTKQAADGKTDWRVDTFLLAGAQIEYDIQPWLRAGLEYQRTSRDSNFPSFRFLDDRVTVRGTVQF